MSDLSDALALAKEHLALLRALDVIAEAVEACGGVAELKAQLEADCERLRDEKDLLTLDVMLLKQDRARLTGGPGEGGQP